MKRGIIVCLLIVSMCECAWGVSMPEGVADALPGEAREMWQELEKDSGSGAGRGAAILWDKACSLWDGVLRQSLRGSVLLLGVVILCAVAEDCMEAAGQEAVPDFVPMAGAMAVTVIAAGNLRSMMGLGVETMEELDLCSKALLPALSAAVASAGGVVTASVRQVSAVFFADILMTLIRQVILPLVYFCIVAAAANAMLPGHHIGVIGKTVNRAATWGLTGLLVLYTGYLALSGAVTGSADAAAVQAARTAMGAVPVVGGIISSAAGTVLAGAAIVKNGVGVVGMLAVLAVCLGPFLRLGVQYLLMKLTAFLAGTIGPGRLVELLEALCGAFGMVLGMTGACAMLLLISIASAVAAVS